MADGVSNELGKYGKPFRHKDDWLFFLKLLQQERLNIPLPNPTNIQSINPASLEVNATPIAVATAIKIYMNHFRLSFIIQSGGLDKWLLNIVCKQKTE